MIWTRSLTVAVLAAVLAAYAFPALAQLAPPRSRVLSVSATSPVLLEVQLTEGDLQIVYARDGQVTLTNTVRGSDGALADQDTAAYALQFEQDGNHLRVHNQPIMPPNQQVRRVSYRIDVPYRTEVRAFVGEGKLTVTGVMGPVNGVTQHGDIKVSYVPKAVMARAGMGNLNLEVIGEHVEAKTGAGNITCIRAMQGIAADTGDGDITLTVVGASKATVANGSGRIEVGGARGNLVASTEHGDLHVKAVPHDDWTLSSKSGTVRVELPPAAGFDMDLSTDSGVLEVDRDDIQKPCAGLLQFHQNANGGGKKIQVRTETGKILFTGGG